MTAAEPKSERRTSSATAEHRRRVDRIPVTRSLELGPLDPAGVLTALSSDLQTRFAGCTPQGRWAVAVGEVEHVTTTGLRRFAAAQVALDDLAARWHQRPARLFGGFSFAANEDTRRRGAPWGADFPALWFVLPRIEVAGDPSRTRIFARAWASPGETTAVEADLDAQIQQTLTRILSPVTSAPVATGVLKDSSGQWYEEAVRTVVGKLASEDEEPERRDLLRKVVLARQVTAEFSASCSMGAIVANLRRHQPECTTYLVRPHTNSRVFVGATPEWLVKKRDQHVWVDGLAGTAPANQGQKLLRSAKDRHEHQVVVDAITRALDDVGANIDRGPIGLKQLADVVHLHTPVAATLSSPTSALSLAARLHPTPAVCGAPRQQALRMLTATEEAFGFDRGWYAGAVGWLDLEGDGELAVALRCALVGDRRATLFAGAGLVHGSDPHGELQETGLKLAAAARALGLAKDDGQ